MVDMFLRVVDTIIELLKTKQENKEQVFTEIIEPLFNEMTLVVHDYFSLFREAEEALLDASTELRDVPPMIRGRHEEFLLTRYKIRDMADLIRREFDDEQIIDFARAIWFFFYNSQPVELMSAPTKSDSSRPPGRAELGVSGAYRVDAVSRSGRPEIRTEIRKARTELEHSWIEITRAYAILRLKYCKPRRLG